MVIKTIPGIMFKKSQTMEGIFEIREYLDGNGSVTANDVVDITKEMEYMAKICGPIDQGSEGQLNVR
jgi:hypothetical protein